MDMYGLPAPDFFRIDDLLDFSNDDLFSSTTDSDLLHHLPPPENPSGNRPSAPPGDCGTANPNRSTNFPDGLCVPSDDITELEWLSKFVDDSFTDFPMNELAGTTNFPSEASVPGRARSKRSRAASTHNSWTSLQESDNTTSGKSKPNFNNNIKKKESSPASSITAGDQSSTTSPARVRKCTHCSSEKTPQWRTGPLGPKTLCNACGVRYKSGRLVPEYRPAASPTFVLSQHSNSHRKVMELRRQKESLRQDNNNHHHQFYHHHHDFKVC
ncbi:hypothetical protein HHK36_028650 [Tetracentron sinense]|uniref:GATA transcription factor n=1 Tax=Tetracentron sinense TaxID=13715 RepID=A0A834YFF1_TETSI|nr:hypothetical protein HHK36_028650 [Tetracentron sinense]